MERDQQDVRSNLHCVVVCRPREPCSVHRLHGHHCTLFAAAALFSTGGHATADRIRGAKSENGVCIGPRVDRQSPDKPAWRKWSRLLRVYAQPGSSPTCLVSGVVSMSRRSSQFESTLY